MANRPGNERQLEESKLDMTVQRIGATAVASPLSTKGAPAVGGAAPPRPAAPPYLLCVVVPPLRGGLLRVRPLQAGAPATLRPTPPPPVGVPAPPRFAVV